MGGLTFGKNSQIIPYFFLRAYLIVISISLINTILIESFLSKVNKNILNRISKSRAGKFTFLEKLTLARCRGRWVDPDSLSKLEKNERWSCNHLLTPANVSKCNDNMLQSADTCKCSEIILQIYIFNFVHNCNE